MSSNNPMKYVAAGVAAVVLAFGAYAVGSSSSCETSSGTASASPGAPAGAASGQVAGNGQRPQNGQAPQDGQAPPGFGTPVTGTAAAKVREAALAAHPGTVERVMKLADGSYVAHVITSSGELHVTVSKDYKVTGAEQGGPGAGGAAPGAPAAPSGSSPSSPQAAPSGSSSSSTSTS